MSSKWFSYLCSCLHTPYPNRLVKRSRSQKLTIRWETDRPDPICMSWEWFPDLLARFYVPKANFSVDHSRSELLPVGRKWNRSYPGLMSQRRTNLFMFGSIPDAHCLISRARSNQASIGWICDTPNPTSMARPWISNLCSSIYIPKITILSRNEVRAES